MISVRPRASAPQPTLLVARARPNGGVIVLGRSLDEVVTLRRILARALSFAILPLAACALGAGFFFARRTAGRIREIDRAIASDHARRLARPPAHPLGD